MIGESGESGRAIGDPAENLLRPALPNLPAPPALPDLPDLPALAALPNLPAPPALPALLTAPHIPFPTPDWVWGGIRNYRNRGNWEMWEEI